MSTDDNATERIVGVAHAALEELKATDVVSLDVRHLTSLLDVMIVASGRSDRHVRAIADALAEHCKSAGIHVASREGHEAGEWILVDLIDVVVHVMLPKTRSFYELEKLWDISRPADDANRDRLRVR